MGHVSAGPRKYEVCKRFCPKIQKVGEVARRTKRINNFANSNALKIPLQIQAYSWFTAFAKGKSS